MTEPGRERPGPLPEEAVLRFLQQDPAFLLRHPELLQSLALAETRPGVGSLLERQVRLLRERLRERERQVALLEQRQQVLGALLALAGRMASAADTGTVASLLEEALGMHCGARWLRCYLFGAGETGMTPPLVALPAGHRLREAFAQVFNVGRPLVDSLQPEHHRDLFGSDTGEVRSTLLLPLAGSGWEGLLALGSRSPDRYALGPELEAVMLLARLAVTRLDRCLPR